MINLESIHSLVADDMAAVNLVILDHLESPITLIKQLGEHILKSGGKRLRPLLALLSAHCFSYKGKDHIRLAAIVEFIHTATLLHDDVVDSSQMRRGQNTANAIWGNQASVLVGDFLFSRSFQMMVVLNSLKVMEILARASNTIAAGEVLQLMNCHQPDTNESQYMAVIEAKTACLFSAATQLGAHIAGQSPQMEETMANYGLHLGNAFQLIDDALDYSGNSSEMGKNIGDDLAEGKPTLPLIYVIQHGNSQQQKLIIDALQQGTLEKLDEIQKIIASTGAIEYTYAAAKREALLAIESLKTVPDSPYKAALVNLANFTLERVS
ncbi:MAG: octaprenyl diphosphate synthase [Legionellales bacterium]|nr:octaprenyl diphosphate synthase [Legionellales bacterium]